MRNLTYKSNQDEKSMSLIGKCELKRYVQMAETSSLLCWCWPRNLKQKANSDVIHKAGNRQFPYEKGSIEKSFGSFSVPNLRTNTFLLLSEPFLHKYIRLN